MSTQSVSSRKERVKVNYDITYTRVFSQHSLIYKPGSERELLKGKSSGTAKTCGRQYIGAIG